MLTKTPPPTEAKLTDQLVAKLPLAGQPGTQYIVRDTELRAFFVLVGRTTKSYKAVADATVDGRRRTFKVTIGPTSGMTVAAARRSARDRLAGIKNKSRLPEAKTPKSLTLAAAWEAYRERCIKKQRQPGTIQAYADHIAGPLRVFVDVPLSELARDPDRVVRWHEDITRRGPRLANNAARTLSAVYCYARKRLDRTLPESPTTFIEMNAEPKSTGGFGLDDPLTAWGDECERLPPIRREFALMTLLSGSRPDALSHARWEHIDIRRRVLHVPNPKGGPKRAFDIPLSRPMVLSLVRLRRTGRYYFPNSPWVFPARSFDGRLSSWSEPRSRLSAYGRDLRRSYRTICAQLGIEPTISKLLMNHITGGDVHDGYLNVSALSGGTAKAQERISKAIILKAFGDPKRLNAWRVV